MDVDTRLLRSFAAVAAEGNLTRAAERLFLTQPALTKQIRQLESQRRQRGHPADHRGVRPAPAGLAGGHAARRRAGPTAGLAGNDANPVVQDFVRCCLDNKPQDPLSAGCADMSRGLTLRPRSVPAGLASIA